jgi:hypothetical protein
VGSGAALRCNGLSARDLVPPWPRRLERGARSALGSRVRRAGDFGLVRGGERLVHGDDALGRRSVITVGTTTFDPAVAAAPYPGESWAQLRDWLAGVGLTVVRHEENGPALGTAWLERR